MMTQAQLADIKSNLAAGRTGWSTTRKLIDEVERLQARNDFLSRWLFTWRCIARDKATGGLEIKRLRAQVTRWQDRARLYHNTIVELQQDREAERAAIVQ